MVRARQPRPWLLVLRSYRALFIGGLGLGLAAPSLGNVILAGVPGTSAGAAGGVLTTINQIGNSTGVALLGTLYLHHPGRKLHPRSRLAELLQRRIRSILPWQVGLYLLAAVLMLALPKKTADHQH